MLLGELARRLRRLAHRCGRRAASGCAIVCGSCCTSERLECKHGVGS
jgi:hypothetical protein